MDTQDRWRQAVRAEFAAHGVQPLSAVHNAAHTIRELEARVAQLEAALVEERARYLASNVMPFSPGDQEREWARQELREEGLLPPA